MSKVPSTSRTRNLYADLGVKNFCDEEEIKRAFRRLVLELHPDRAEDGESVRRFHAVVEAYAVLRDAPSRRRYDRWLRHSLSQPIQFKSDELLIQLRKSGKRHYSPRHYSDEDFKRFVAECKWNFHLFLNNLHRARPRSRVHSRATMPAEEYDLFIEEGRNGYRDFLGAQPRIRRRAF